MRCAFTLLLLTSSIICFGQAENAILKTTLPGKNQPEYFLDRAEKLGWTELASERTSHSSQFNAENGKRISYSSAALVNYKDESGNWKSVDIRPKKENGRWEATNQPSPVIVNSDGSIQFLPDGKTNITYSNILKINGVIPNSSSEVTKNGLHVWFKNIVPGVDKQIEFKNSAFKYNYILNNAPTISGSEFIIQEKISLPINYTLIKNIDENTGAEFLQIKNEKNEVVSEVLPLVCYDDNGKTNIGAYSIVKHIENTNSFIIELKIQKSWLLNNQTNYPVIIDPLVTGPTANWSGGLMPSCFLPSYNQDSILVTVPGAITVTDLFVTSSYYASPFTTTVMGDGRMYFSTNCNQTTLFQVQPPAGNTAGTAYLEDFDLNSPLMCCLPQQCTSFTFWLSMHLSRTSNGTTCNTTYLYYNTATTWPFSAYVEGYTPEAYAATMTFSPNSICADVCQTTVNIFARYGVPPFTYTHPWSTSTVVFGTPTGCSNASYVKQLPITLPNCPNYCDPSTGLAVPPPVVTDACGAVVAGYSPSYTLTVKPVPSLTLVSDTIVACSNQPFTFQWNDCLGGSSVYWSGAGIGGTGLTVVDTIENTSGAPILLSYEINGGLNGCAILPDTGYALIYPFIVPDFNMEPNPPITNNTILFTDITQYNGNTATGWFWNFGDTTGSFLQNPAHLYTEPGDYLICFFASTNYGCSDTICKIIQVIPANLELPNVISPNSDGSNDALFIKYLDQYETNSLSVFNRWGTLIYKKENYANDWKAENVSDGTYYYVINLPGDKNLGQFLHIMRTK